MGFSFNELDLTGLGTGMQPRLRPGRYLCTVMSAELKPTKSKGAQVVVELADVSTGLRIKDFINVHVPTSEESTRIGRERLKAILTFGGHPSPDKPGDIGSLKGLTLGVKVERDFYMKDGVEKETSRVAEAGGYFQVEEGMHLGADPESASRPKSAAPAKQPSASGMFSDMKDDIPL